jgi:hypothetical protein
MSLEDDFQELKDELREFKRDFGTHLRTTLLSTEAAKGQMEMFDLLIARVRALETVNRGVMAALHSNDAFVAGVAYGAKHRDAVFNGSEITDEQIAEFKARLRDLLPKDLRRLAD